MPPSRLQQTGAHILARGASPAGSRPPSSAGSAAGGRHSPASSASSPNLAQYEYPPAPPSASRTGRLYREDSCPQLDPFGRTAENLPGIKSVKMKRVAGRTEALPQCVWSDSVQHLGEDPWPAHAVPLFVFYGADRPRPAYREEVKFLVKEDKYVNFGLRLRCGGGDRYMGGSVGLVHSPDRREACPGQDGQLVTITDIIVNPDNTIIVHAVGDLPFRVQRAWMPRGLRGLQCAIVEVEPAAPRLETILDTCDQESGLRRFGRLLRAAAPAAAARLADPGEKFTVFVPTTNALNAALGGLRDEDLVGRPDVEAVLVAHIVPGRVACEALYNGRALTAIDGSSLIVSFKTWPRGDPRVNDLLVEHMDVMCANGVIHTIDGLLTPNPAPAGRGRR